MIYLLGRGVLPKRKKQEDTMNQELKNYFCQFIMAQINNMYNMLYCGMRYEYIKRFFSKTYLSSRSTISEPIYKNIKFCNSIINEDDDYNYSKFKELLLQATAVHLKENIEKANIYLKENINSSFLLKIEEDIDDSFFENLLDNYLPFALFTLDVSDYMPKEFLEEAFIYCTKNNLFKNAKTIKDIFNECKSIYIGDIPKEELDNTVQKSLPDNLKSLDEKREIENVIYYIINTRYFEVGKYSNSKTYYRLSDDDDFLRLFYNALSREEKEIMVFNSSYIDLVEKNICQDPDIIEGAKKYLNIDMFSKKDAFFASKYYPDIFEEKVNAIMVGKQRDKIFNMDLFKIAISFSGITKKMARYMRSETSEKRAFRLFEQIKDKLFVQPNISEILTQFADTKHDRLLGSVIRNCPKQYLYLFISNKLVRNSHTYSHRSYKERSREQE